MELVLELSLLGVACTLICATIWMLQDLISDEQRKVALLRSALQHLLDAVKQEPAMNSHKHDALGVEVLKALEETK